MVLGRALVIGWLLASCGVPAFAGGGEAHRWLARMVEAGRTLAYEGTFFYRRGDAIESMWVAHRNGEDGERERIVSLDGARWEVTRHDDVIICVLPEDAEAAVGKRNLRSVSSAPLFNAGKVPEDYRLVLRGSDRTAGREAVHLHVLPRDELRYGYQLWIDSASGLLLRSRLLTPAGEALEEMAFTNVRVPAQISDGMLESTLGGEGFTAHTSRIEHGRGDPDPATDKVNSTWQVSWLPGGFTMRKRVLQPLARGSAPVEHLVFSDGLASVSIFIEELEALPERLEGASTLGAISAFGRAVGAHQVTVVGEVPPETVQRMGQSVQRP